MDFAHFRFPWGRRWALLLVLGFSRLLWLRFFERQDKRTLFEGLEEAFRFLDGVPKEILFDQMRSVIVEDRRWEGGPLVENPEFVRFAHHWQFRARACRPYRARTKGKVERPIRYVRDNFVYGREFLNDEDLDAQLERWLREVANVRHHRTIQQRPLKRFEREERGALGPLAQRPYRSLVLPTPMPPRQRRKTKGLVTPRRSRSSAARFSCTTVSPGVADEGRECIPTRAGPSDVGRPQDAGRVLSENADGAARSNPRGVLKTRGDQPTRHWLCDRRPRADLSSRPSVPSNWRARTPLLCGVAVVIAEQAAQSLTTSHLPVRTADAFFRFEQRVPEPLMVALSVIMMDELSDGTAQRWLTEEDHPLQALALDRQNKPFDVSVHIRRTVRQPNDVSSGVLEQIAKLRGELLVAVHDEESLAAQKAVEWVGEIPTDLHHERAIRPRSDSGQCALFARTAR